MPRGRAKKKVDNNSVKSSTKVSNTKKISKKQNKGRKASSKVEEKAPEIVPDVELSEEDKIRKMQYKLMKSYKQPEILNLNEMLLDEPIEEAPNNDNVDYKKMASDLLNDYKYRTFKVENIKFNAECFEELYNHFLLNDK